MDQAILADRSWEVPHFVHRLNLYLELLIILQVTMFSLFGLKQPDPGRLVDLVVRA